jgi:hypothetical protein
MTLPVYAVLGHPNEGKSSVVSTLTENERVKVSNHPGETVKCKRFVIQLDGEEALVIVYTPGFQNPSATLKWFEAWEGPESEMVDAFMEAHRDQVPFHHDLELMTPLRGRAGILYVADASRPLREADRQEMEILRLIGLPRLALLNFKRDDRSYLTEWKEALNRRFNLVREFNAHLATFQERMSLLEAMALLNPEQEAPLKDLRSRLEEQWSTRTEEAALLLEELLLNVLRHQTTKPFRHDQPEDEQFENAREAYREEIRAMEGKARRQWRELYHHRELPGSSDNEELLQDELFAEKVWRLLGLSRRQLMLIGAMTGGAAGVGADLATGGISFGVFTAGAAVLGGWSGWMGGPKLGAKRLPFPGKRTWAKEQIVVGPAKDPQLLFILTDRSLLYLTRLMNWAHGRRDHQAFLAEMNPESGPVRKWSEAQRKVLTRWIRHHASADTTPSPESSKALRSLLQDLLTSRSKDKPHDDI